LLNWRFAKALDAADPMTTVAYFWPDPPRRLLEKAKRLGIPTFRQMTNCTREETREVLRDAYVQEGMRPRHGISARSARREGQDLLLYDRIFCSDQVVPGLLALGVNRDRIALTSSAWSGAYLAGGVSSIRPPRPVTFLFVGTVCVRKGVATLLEAWEASRVDGRLRIVGETNREMIRILARYERLASVEFIPFTDDIGAQYASADVFVFPTFEEGGPKVTYEAAGSGLPVITTPMGVGRIIKDGVNGFIVEAGDAQGLAAAMNALADSPETRQRFGKRARADAARYTYDLVARERALEMAAALPSYAPAPARAGEWVSPSSARRVSRAAWLRAARVDQNTA
jgi:glycosyltransferase involved in cell wall biosynthesis